MASLRRAARQPVQHSTRDPARREPSDTGRAGNERHCPNTGRTPGHRQFKLTGFALGAAMAIAAVGAVAADGITYRQVADMLYLVMSSDRAVYTRMVVQRLTRDEKILTASEHFEDDSALPLPAQMFRFGAEMVADETEDFSYSLLSLHPINRKNGPGTDLEREGLEYRAGLPSPARCPGRMTTSWPSGPT